uniref:Uncharacterized protein n=1 Tax=Opuntia streptacantha TaxID=393608 RepID=A0A7C9DJP9_OPUST
MTHETGSSLQVRLQILLNPNFDLRIRPPSHRPFSLLRLRWPPHSHRNKSAASTPFTWTRRSFPLSAFALPAASLKVLVMTFPHRLFAMAWYVLLIFLLLSYSNHPLESAGGTDGMNFMTVECVKLWVSVC